jgi:DNA-binding MarR family transcriptional regulator
MYHVPSGSPTGSIDDSLLALEDSLSVRISVVAKLLDRRLARLVVDRFGLAVAEYRVLSQVALYPRSTVRLISERTFVDKAQVSRAVAALETSGLLMRALPAADRRSPVFTATKTGRTLIRKIIPLRQAQERELADCLRGDAQAVGAALGQLIEVLSEGGDVPPVPLAPAQRRPR